MQKPIYSYQKNLYRRENVDLTKNKKALGKGLGALIPDIENTENDNVMEIDVQQIRPNSNQPRRIFDDSKLEELAQSITQHGVIQPLIVVRIDNGYQIVAGERRWRAAVQANLSKVPVVIRDLSEQEIMEIALIENIQREDLNDIEMALAYKELMGKYNITQGDLAKQLGKSRVSITNTLRLLQLPRMIQQYIQDDKITSGHARTLITLPDNLRIKYAEKIIDHNLSVRETEQLVSRAKANNGDKDNISKSSSKDDKVYNGILQEVEEQLQIILGTKVSIKNNKSKGKIEINYYSNEDLDRISNIIKGDVSRETLA